MKIHEFFPPLTLEDGRSPVPHGWGCAAGLARDSGARLALEVSGKCGDVTVTVCDGPLSDMFRTAFYGPVVDPPAPEGGGTDAEFDSFLEKAKRATDAEFPALLAAEC